MVFPYAVHKVPCLARVTCNGVAALEYADNRQARRAIASVFTLHGRCTYRDWCRHLHPHLEVAHVWLRFVVRSIDRLVPPVQADTELKYTRVDGGAAHANPHRR
jgi:hypothetical protein